MKLKVDESECIRCGTCVETCPVRILKLNEKKNPEAIEGRDEYCINCGHCVCVCPKAALSLDSMPIETLKELSAGWRLSPEEIELYFKGRRSIRSYKTDAVEKSVIEKIIDIARYAPSGINRQPVHWAVIYDNKKVKDLADLTIEWMRGLIAEKSELAASLNFEGIVKTYESGIDGICRGAPHAALVYGLKEDPLAANSCVLAMAHFELICLSFNLGSCWAGYLQMALNSSSAAMKAAALPSRTACHGAMLFGYPKYEYNCIPERNKPKIIWR